MPLDSDGYFTSIKSSVNTWECDDIGHMNVQFYTARASDAAFFVRHELGLTPSVIRASNRTMITLEEHYRYHRELLAGDMYTIRTRLIEMREKTLVVLHEIWNAATNELSATIVTVGASFDMNTRELVAWDEETRAKGQALCGPLPEHAEGRSVKRETRLKDITLEDTEGGHFIESYRGTVSLQHCDDFGRMNTQFYIARYSEGSGHLWQGLGVDRQKLMESRRGSVVLEQRLNFIRDVSSGDILIIKSALTELGNKTVRLCHFMFNAETGVLAATSEVTAILLDLDARKAVAFSDTEKAELAKHVCEIEKAGRR
tara:strand:- start:37071 stop:38015 length:945 start_codon:yes stop_codon:yes gene_type:complete